MSERRGPRPAEERLRRLLVMLPWVMERGRDGEGVPLAELAERFALTEHELVKDLELASMCGLPPFVDELIDVFIDEGSVFVGVPRLFTRPLRLNAVEAFELLAAGRVAMQLPGSDPSGPLGRGLRKLARALGEDDTGVLRVEIAKAPFTDEIAEAAQRDERLVIEYWSASTDECTERSIVPRQVFSDRGDWYVTADDDRSGSLRTFRIDRIRKLTATGEHMPSDGTPLPKPGEWFADGSIPRVTVRVAPAARWVTERYPVDDVSGPDAEGWVTARLPVASERWLARLVVRLGPDIELLAAGEFGDVAPKAAARIVARYRP
jgi:proteasome accessory factor C